MSEKNIKPNCNELEDEKLEAVVGGGGRGLNVSAQANTSTESTLNSPNKKDSTNPIEHKLTEGICIGMLVDESLVK